LAYLPNDLVDKNYSSNSHVKGIYKDDNVIKIEYANLNDVHDKGASSNGYYQCASQSDFNCNDNHVISSDSNRLMPNSDFDCSNNYVSDSHICNDMYTCSNNDHKKSICTSADDPDSTNSFVINSIHSSNHPVSCVNNNCALEVTPSHHIHSLIHSHSSFIDLIDKGNSGDTNNDNNSSLNLENADVHVSSDENNVCSCACKSNISESCCNDSSVIDKNNPSNINCFHDCVDYEVCMHVDISKACKYDGFSNLGTGVNLEAVHTSNLDDFVVTDNSDVCNVYVPEKMDLKMFQIILFLIKIKLFVVLLLIQLLRVIIIVCMVMVL
jgi:hypothetical protein